MFNSIYGGIRSIRLIQAKSCHLFRRKGAIVLVFFILLKRRNTKFRPQIIRCHEWKCGANSVIRDKLKKVGSGDVSSTIAICHDQIVQIKYMLISYSGHCEQLTYCPLQKWLDWNTIWDAFVSTVNKIFTETSWIYWISDSHGTYGHKENNATVAIPVTWESKCIRRIIRIWWGPTTKQNDYMALGNHHIFLVKMK